MSQVGFGEVQSGKTLFVVRNPLNAHLGEVAISYK